MSDHEAYVSKAEKGVDSLLRLRQRRPILFWLLVAALAMALAVGAFDKLWGIPKLREENDTLRRQLDEKSVEIQRLETQLAPFRAVALERHPGSEPAALSALASEVVSLSEGLEQQKRTIRELKVRVGLTVSVDLPRFRRRSRAWV